jgi:prepilin-type N-terminal cleavage/methylation domain-containing protein
MSGQRIHPFSRRTCAAFPAGKRVVLAIPNAGQARRLNGMRNRGFTLIEVLVTLLLIGLVLPTVMRGITLAMAVGNEARHRGDAAALAKSQIGCLILAVSQGQNPILAADAVLGGTQYHWKASVQPWNQDTTTLGIQEIDLIVSWTDRGRLESLSVSSLAYNREQSG